jgi:hypothetical protein
MREIGMRTTLTIDDDVLAAAKALADQRDETIGGVISDLARQALKAAPRGGNERDGVPLLPRKAGERPITLDIVNTLRDEAP